MVFSWTKELTEILLVIFEGNENLYNSKHKDYTNRMKRNASLEAIRLELSKEASITIADIKNKIQTLRTQFKKEKNMAEASFKSGAGIEDLYEPKLWCYNQLLFLKPHCITRPSSSNIAV